MKKLGILCSGSGTNFQAIIDSILDGNIDGEIACMIYNRKDAYAKVRAEKADIPALYINKLQYNNEISFTDAIFNNLLDFNVDIVILAGFLSKIGITTIEHYKNKIINTHPALIPSFCGKGFYGLNVHSAVIEYGAKISGCTIHFIDKNYDTGPVIMQKSIPVLYNDTPESLANRILPIEHELLTRAIGLICDDKISVIGRKVVIK